MQEKYKIMFVKILGKMKISHYINTKLKTLLSSSTRLSTSSTFELNLKICGRIKKEK